MTATYQENVVLDGVEIIFSPSIPPVPVRDALRAAGFILHRRKRFWYAKRTQATLAFAKVLCEPEQESGVVAKGGRDAS